MGWRRRGIGKCGWVVAATVTAASLASAAASKPVSEGASTANVGVCQLSANRTTYDRKVLFVDGVITTIRSKTPASGRPYTTVQLKDVSGNCFVRLFFLGHQNFLSSGLHVTVLARYYRIFRYFRLSFAHELQPTQFTFGACTRYLTSGVTPSGYSFVWVKSGTCP